MKIILKIPSPSTVSYKVKGKDYTEAANYMLSKPFNACYNANPNYSHKFKDGNTHQITVTAKPTITMPQWSGAR